MGHSAAGVAETDGDSPILADCGDRELPQTFPRHRSLAVLCQIQQYLQQALPVRPNQRQTRLDFDRQPDVLFPKGGFHNDAILFEQRRQIDAARLIRHLAKIHGGNFFEREDQVPQRLEILTLRQIRGERRAFRQIRMGHRDGSAYVPDLVRNGADQNSRSGQKLMQTQLFAVPQIFGTIHHHRRQPGSRAGAVSGKPDIGEENFTVLPSPPALHRRTKRRPLVT